MSGQHDCTHDMRARTRSLSMCTRRTSSTDQCDHISVHSISIKHSVRIHTKHMRVAAVNAAAVAAAAAAYDGVSQTHTHAHMPVRQRDRVGTSARRDPVAHTM
jgi:hypothetical protein